MVMSKGLLLSTRNIFAVCFGLQQKCSKVSLYLEHFCCKPSQTFGEKFLNVWKVIIPCSCPEQLPKLPDHYRWWPVPRPPLEQQRNF